MTCSHIGAPRALYCLAATALLAIAVAGSASSPALADGLLAQPSDDAMCLLYFQFAKTAPPLDDFAAQAAAVRQANEFDRAKATAAEKAKLEALVTSLQSVTSIRVNIGMSLGEYNSAQSEYDLSGFGADEFVSYGCFDGQFRMRLRFDNAPYAQSWSLDPAAAEAVLKRDQGTRDVIAVTTVDLTGVDPAGPGDPPVLVGNVREVSVVGGNNRAPLGHYVVKAP
jgi:hypothetical protein